MDNKQKPEASTSSTSGLQERALRGLISGYFLAVEFRKAALDGLRSTFSTELDAAAKLRDSALKGLRSGFSAQVDASLTSLPSGAIGPVVWATSGDWARPGDQQVSTEVERKAEEFFEGSRPEKFGKYDLRMAAGWTPKGPMKVNGIMVEKPETVTNLLAVFVRDKEGNVELLDPSVKMNSLGEATVLPKALWGKGQTDVDRRWKETAGTFVEVQLAAAAASLGVGAVTKGMDVLGNKVPKMAQLAETATSITKQSQKVVAPVSGLTAVSGVSAIGGAYAQNAYFSPKAVQGVVDSISSVLANPEKLTPRKLRENLNGALHDYSFKEGGNAKQVYVPSLRSGDDPFKRLDSLLGGGVEAHKKEQNPWQEWGPPSRIQVGDIREGLKEDKSFKKAFLRVAEKALSGAALSDEEVFVLRVKINTGEYPLSLTGKSSGASQLKYSEEEKQETIKRLRLELRDDLIMGIQDGRYPDIARRMGTSSEAAKEEDMRSLKKMINPDDKTLSEFARGEAQRVSQEIELSKNKAAPAAPIPSGP